MCDNHSIDDMIDYASRNGLSRRQFGALSVGGGLAMALLPAVSNAVEVTGADVEVKTPDGTADCYFVHPTTGTHAGVLIWPDIMGLRPAFKAMAKRLAESGYSVLVVNPFYRQKKGRAMPEGASFADDATRKMLFGLAGALTPETNVTDARAFVAWLDSQGSVNKQRKIGTTGYCMGGPITMRTAAALPDRIGAGASFHGGGLATDKPDSPHLLVPKMKAQYLFAIAENDDAQDPAAKTKLKEAFAAAKLPAEIEVYAGARHGWCPPDSTVYNEAQAEKAWSRMLALFGKALV
jgi:carboxymethylenebutenolidase